MNSELRSESDIGSGLFRLPKTDSKIILGMKYDKSNKILISKEVNFRTARGEFDVLDILNACGYVSCFKQRSLEITLPLNNYPKVI